MHLTRVTCEHFRCLDAVDFAPAPGVNVIRGLNAQGKTSLLEAILYGATSKSHRTNTESELLQHGAESFHIALEARRADRDVAIQAHWWRGAKRFKVNGIAQNRLSDILGRIHVVFFSPEDVELVKGGAGGRRRFLDMEISQVEPAYLAALQQYRQVLRQRNELLKRSKVDEALLDVWDTQMAAQGAVVIRAREAYVAELAAYTAEAYAAVARAESLALAYEPDVADPDSLYDALVRTRQNDLRRGQTQRGPHRDDLAFRIGDRPARAYGSQGQQKSASLALKLAEVELVHARTGEYPVLMLDEVLAELDNRRATQLFAVLGKSVQSLVTTTELERREGVFAADAVFRLEGGRLAEEEEGQ